MKKIISTILAIILLLSLISCSPDDEDPMDGRDTIPNPVVTIPEDVTPEETSDPDEGVMPIPGDVREGTIDYLLISVGEDYNNINSLTVYPNGDGTLHVEYVGEYKKVGDFDMSVESKIIAAIEESGLKVLNGVNEYEEGEANGSMYVSYKDGSYIGAGFSGNVPDEYKTGYAKLDEFFRELVKDLPVYVPQPIVQGSIHEDDLAVIKTIIEKADLDYIDSYVIAEVAKDDFFSFQLGLSGDEGILRGVTFGPMMITTAYSLSMVVLEDVKFVADVCKDFENNIDWRKWVCVAPKNGIIAVKDNVVICLLGSDSLFSQTCAGITAAGFEIVNSLSNPDMY